MSTKCLTLLRIEMPRWPLEKDAFLEHFKGIPLQTTFRRKAFAQKIVQGLSKYLLRQLDTPVRAGPRGSTTMHSAAAMSSKPLCWYTHTEIRLCADSNGNTYWCPCDHYQCDDDSEYWQCHTVEPI